MEEEAGKKRSTWCVFDSLRHVVGLRAEKAKGLNTDAGLKIAKVRLGAGVVTIRFTESSLTQL